MAGNEDLGPKTGLKHTHPLSADFNIEVYGKVRARPHVSWPGFMGMHASPSPFEI